MLPTCVRHALCIATSMDGQSPITRSTLVVASLVLCAAGVRAQGGTPIDPLDPAAGPPPETPQAPAVEPPTAEPPPEGADAQLLAAWLRLDAALAVLDVEDRQRAISLAIQGLAALDDDRAVPMLVRLSRSDASAVRLSSLAALGGFARVPAALARLQQTLEPGTDAADAAVALPALLLAAKSQPSVRVPCPAGHRCGPDEALLHALLAYASADAAHRAQAVADVVATGDARALPFLWRLAKFSDDARAPALDGLAALVDLPPARALFLDLLARGSTDGQRRAIAALDALADDDITSAFVVARTGASDDTVRAALDERLRKRAPEQLAAIVAEEARAAAELAAKPNAFDVGSRVAISVAAAAGAAAGGAAASSLVADRVAPGTGACYGLWGACAGASSAAAIGWFGLGDARLSGTDVGLAFSTSIMGTYAGLLLPAAITNEPIDTRHRVYAGAGGALVGLLGGTTVALFLDLQPSDLAELDVTVAASNALAAGFVLSLPPSPDARPLWWTQLGATAAGLGAGATAAYFLDLDGGDLAHVGVTSGVGLLAGLSTGGALAAAFESQRSPSQVIGAGLLGLGAGAVAGGALGQLDLRPTPSGMVYEAWAALDGGVLGMGAGFLALSLAPEQGAQIPLGAAAVGLAGGAASTMFFPDGIAMDVGDLALQPLFVAFSLYHSAVLAGTAGASPAGVAAAALIAPATVSAGLTYGAPFVRTSVGDILMVGGMMGVGAYLSSMGMLSFSARDPAAIPSWGWVLGTSIGMDLGVAAGVGLDLLPWHDVGWKTTYVLAVATGVTLVASLPGSLLAAPPGDVEVPDVMLASSVLGLGLGLATMPFIDFRVAPDWGLGKPFDDLLSLPDDVSVTPTALVVPPIDDQAPQVALGVVGRF